MEKLESNIERWNANQAAYDAETNIMSGYLASISAYLDGVFAYVQMVNELSIDGGLYYDDSFAADDFGNYAYGYAARIAGIDPYTALMGAGGFGITNGSAMQINMFLFDERKDSYNIIRGYFHRGLKK